MELTRRDALAALSGAGIVVGGGAASLARDSLTFEDDDREGLEPSAVLDTLDAVAGIVYPSAVENVSEFVETYSVARIRERPAYREGVRAATASLDGYARVHFDAERYLALDEGHRESVLDLMGVDTAEGRPDGTRAERVRYYVVDELLYALYTSPTGGELVGLENPQGHPGGLQSYQRGPRG